jgi:hypothetical protein
MDVTLNSVLPQEDIHKHFVLEGSRLYKKLASGAVTQLKSLDGKQVVTMFNKHRLRGVDIAWCLIHGNWPKFSIAQLRDDPLDFSESNLWPARMRVLRYIQTKRGNLYYHPLSTLPHPTPERCRRNWEELAREAYAKDLMYVLKLEESERILRQQYLRETAAVRIEVPDHSHKRTLKPARPKEIPGREWHWWDGRWIDVPVACHVADDYRVRIQAVLGGATWFQYSTDLGRVLAYLPDGSLWTPATE